MDGAIRLIAPQSARQAIVAVKKHRAPAQALRAAHRTARRTLRVNGRGQRRRRPPRVLERRVRLPVLRLSAGVEPINPHLLRCPSLAPLSIARCQRQTLVNHRQVKSQHALFRQGLASGRHVLSARAGRPTPTVIVRQFVHAPSFIPFEREAPMPVDLATMSRGSRSTVPRATGPVSPGHSLDDKEILRVKFYDDLGKVTGSTPA